MSEQALESLALEYTRLALEALNRPLTADELQQQENAISESQLSSEELIKIGKAKLAG